MENIGKKIKKLRDSHNLSQDRFGKKIGLSGKTISAYETGRAVPPLKIINKISVAYNTQYVGMNIKTKNLVEEKLNTLEKEMLNLKNILSEDFII
ncbi:hypothetical protein A2V49_04015 [candidate division WWE3 bacterium RBG_19FT_COMBO_34_6]|uniref:HTH cro/C1-type domain-containing protein n=1 Tax=candidate division WWE3 bacterium RBG_19FT_COMBO_34_6 TaxID=1802612 RepID=A0A1F4UNB7_UNCKA|nr:MAG: hypothetical protein A2V49_04015 [candidate division WWE3 bacterium RBG_19FT_COMBO_34_6]